MHVRSIASCPVIVVDDVGDMLLTAQRVTSDEQMSVNGVTVRGVGWIIGENGENNNNNTMFM